MFTNFQYEPWEKNQWNLQKHEYFLPVKCFFKIVWYMLSILLRFQRVNKKEEESKHVTI